jgi:hypothetical protein
MESNRELDAAHQVPDAVGVRTVLAPGVLSKALETMDRARGHLYGFHQLTGSAAFELGDAVRLLREAGHDEQAARVERDIVGRNVIPGHGAFQIIEACNSTYYQPFAAMERGIVDELGAGRDHLHEAGLKAARRTHHHPDHTATPPPPETQPVEVRARPRSAGSGSDPGPSCSARGSRPSGSDQPDCAGVWPLSFRGHGA